MFYEVGFFTEYGDHCKGRLISEFLFFVILCTGLGFQMKVIALEIYINGLNSVAHDCVAGTVLVELSKSRETVVQHTWIPIFSEQAI